MHRKSLRANLLKRVYNQDIFGRLDKNKKKLNIQTADLQVKLDII